MSEQLSFPGLGLQFDINRVAFTVGSRPIYWYGILIAAAFLAAAFYVMGRSKAFGLDKDRVMDVVLGSVLLGIVGARLYYVIFSWDTYKDNLRSVFFIWEGGIAIYGGIIGGVLAAALVCKWRRVKFLPMLDLAAGGLLLGQAVGRWGNFVNIEAFGANTTAPWGMTSPTVEWYLRQHASDLEHIGVLIDPTQPVHPTFFYESLWCLLGFAFIAWFTTRRRFDGEVGLIYLGWYGLGRFFIEGLRTDSLLLGTMRISQILAILCVIASVFGLILIRSKIKRANDPDFMPLYVNTDEGKAVIAGEFYKKNEPVKNPVGETGEDADTEGANAEETDTEESDVTSDGAEDSESGLEETDESGSEETAEEKTGAGETEEADAEETGKPDSGETGEGTDGDDN